MPNELLHSLLSSSSSAAELSYNSTNNTHSLHVLHEQYTVNRHHEDADKNQVFSIRDNNTLVQVASIHEKLNVLPKAFNATAHTHSKRTRTNILS
jgi:hypothetical protein